MQNEKVIVINGISRGGTNILWNMIQSHPAVCGAMYETDQLFAPWTKNRLRIVTDTVFRNPLLRIPPFITIAAPLIDQRLFNVKLRNLNDFYNGFSTEGVPYTRAEIERSAVCLKSINNTIYSTPLFARIYGERLYTIGIVRNGYGICESWVRRGIPAAKAGLRYRQYVETMFKYREQNERYMIVKFEDILQAPFETLSSIFTFCDLEPTTVDKFRLKSKPILTEDGSRKVPFGSRNVKYWLDRDTIQEFLVPNIATIQSDALSDADRQAFEAEALPVLQQLDYA
ncbi:MAG: sulfotransferase [Anaerolineae bacterium]|nr:sulfotransferase [Anaerolineae bacterium]